MRFSCGGGAKSLFPTVFYVTLAALLLAIVCSYTIDVQ